MSGESVPLIDKVVLYVVDRGRLLVFLQPKHPGILLQVPGGTVEAGEALEVAVRRELAEETGLTDVAQVTRLGSRSYSFDFRGIRQIHQRHFFHVELESSQHLRERWSYMELSSSLGFGPIELSLFWLEFDVAARDLGYEYGALLPELRATMESGNER